MVHRAHHFVGFFWHKQAMTTFGQMLIFFMAFKLTNESTMQPKSGVMIIPSPDGGGSSSLLNTAAQIWAWVADHQFKEVAASQHISQGWVGPALTSPSRVLNYERVSPLPCALHTRAATHNTAQTPGRQQVNTHQRHLDHGQQDPDKEGGGEGGCLRITHGGMCPAERSDTFSQGGC